MKRLYLISFLLFSLAFYSVGQVNLVFNPSFEILYNCPSGPGQIDSAIGWGAPINGGHPELDHVCCTYPPRCGVPAQTDYATSQYPHTGNGYAGLHTALSGHENTRGYIQSKLVRKLLSGNIYCVAFYVSLSDQSNSFIKPLGAYMDDGSVSTPSQWGLAAVTPQVFNTSILLNDTVNWMKIEGSFIAHGNEQYITLGNFFPDSLSDNVLIGTPSFWFSYYYIDDVSVIDASLPAFAGNDTLVHNPGDSVFIGRPSEVGLDEDCIWFVDGIPIDTIAGMWVKPDSTTTYILEQTICGNVSHDTITVTVSGVGVDEYQNSNQWVKVYPNPSDGDITIQYKLIGTDKCEFELYDVFGRKVYTHPLPSDATSFTLNGTYLSSGVYYYRAMQGQKSMGKGKVVVIK